MVAEGGWLLGGLNVRYEICMRLGESMNDIEQHDYYSNDGQDAVPSWIRAHFILEGELEYERSGSLRSMSMKEAPQVCTASSFRLLC